MISLFVALHNKSRSREENALSPHVRPPSAAIHHGESWFTSEPAPGGATGRTRGPCHLLEAEQRGPCGQGRGWGRAALLHVGWEQLWLPQRPAKGQDRDARPGGTPTRDPCAKQISLGGWGLEARQVRNNRSPCQGRLAGYHWREMHSFCAVQLPCWGGLWSQEQLHGGVTGPGGAAEGLLQVNGSGRPAGLRLGLRRKKEITQGGDENTWWWGVGSGG